jgi:hypothetical protein
MKKIITLSLALMLSVSSLAQAMPTSPVSLKYNVPKNIMLGEVVTTTVRLIANKDLASLTISASAYDGLVLISSGNETVFENITRGDSREIEVTIQLGNDLGYLAMETTSIDTASREQYNNQAIRFGEPNTTTRSRMKADNLIVDSSGETLFLMQPEVN